MKKKTIAIFLAALMLASLSACGSEKQKEQTSEVTTEETKEEISKDSEDVSSESDSTDEVEELLGGWTEAESPEVTDEVKSLLEKALEETVGAQYTPVALLETQVVAGTNYRLLCRRAVTSPEAEETYAYVTIYADLNGGAELLDIADTGVKTNLSEEAEGAYEAVSSPELTEEAKKAFDQSIEGLTGVSYEPLALLATQVVSGTNYVILCRSQVVYPGADSSYSLMTVYQDLQGKAETLDIEELKDEETESVESSEQ